MVRRVRASFLHRVRHNGGIRRRSFLLLAFALFVPFVTFAGAPVADAVAAGPQLHVTTLVSGLDHPWDVGFLSDGTMFFTQRAGVFSVRLTNGTIRQLTADMSDFWASSETGLLSVEVDPLFASNRRIYTCQGTTDNDFTVQVVAWTVNTALTAVTRVNDPLVGGIDGTSGRHGGCQLRVASDGALLIGTGDAGFGTNPQDTHSLAGKTLRVDRFNGAGLSGNPFFGNPSAGDPRIQTIGHRNVQGLAIQPGTGTAYNVEHGPDRDDEINQLVNGGNYGWDPVPTPYNESVPMTDKTKFPSAIDAAWSSGFPTVAPSAATFLTGSAWGSWQGALAVSELKGASLHLFSVSGNTATEIATPPELNGTHSRLRAAEMGPDNVLYLTTDNGNNIDEILAVSPRIDTGGVAIAFTGGDSFYQVARGTNGEVWERHESDTSPYSPWASLGGRTSDDPDISSWGSGRVDVFVRGTNGQVWHKAANGNVFGASWESLGAATTSGPTAVSWGPNRIDVFVRGTDNALWHISYSGGWSTWEWLGGALTAAPDVASWSANRLDVFGRGTDGAIWHRAWTGAGWSDWESLGGSILGGPGATSSTTNRVDVFAVGADGALWTRTSFGGPWTAWMSLGGSLTSDPDATRSGVGTELVLARGVDNAIWARVSNGSSWQPWTRSD
jgi:glucose/arabinose dehydrogenase